MGRRFSGNGGGGLAAVASAPRAIAASQQVPAQGGALYTLAPPGLLQPIAFSKTGGNANLTINATTGAVSAASALAGGASQTISGAIAGADGVTIPYSVTLTGVTSVPAAPLMTLTGGNAQVGIAWTDGADGGSAITGHRLYRGTSAGGEVLVGTITTVSPYVDTGLANGTVYFYRLSALNAIGEGAQSVGASVTPAPSPSVPAAPAITLTAAAGQVTIGWSDGTANGSPITAHKLYRGTSAGGTVLIGTITTVSPYVDTGRTAGQAYFYRLSAVNGVGEGALSVEASATVPGGATALMPTNWDFVAYGDSRTENGIGGTLTTTGGYIPSSGNTGPVAYIGPMTGNRLRPARYPGFGISASTTEEGAAIPRGSASGTTTAGAATNKSNSSYASQQTWYRGGDSTNKGADYAANSGAGVVVLLYGTNDANRNANTQYAGTSRANILTMLNSFKNTQLKVVYNETPCGIGPDGNPGTIRGSAAAADFKAFSDWLSSLDYASGSPNARSDVIVVDSFTAMTDSAASTSTAYRNKAGYLRDGLHFTPWGAKQLAILLHNRLTAVFGSAYTNLPAQAVVPVSNGTSIAADTIGAHAPFVHTNPLLTPGTAGTVQGANFGTAPTPTTIPQGWAISGAGTYAGVAVVCDKTGLDADGYPTWKITVSGTLVDQSSYVLSLYQAAQATGQAITPTDKLRAVARLGVAAGSKQLNFVRVRAIAGSSPTGTVQTAIALAGSAGSGTTDRLGYYINSNGADAGGSSDIVLTQIIDLADPNMNTANGGPGVSTATSCAMYIDAQFANYTGATADIAATIMVSRAGVYKATS